MPRTARIVKFGHPYHVTQRGNFRQTVFDEDEDFMFYKCNLKESSKRYNLDILAWCLMSNHVHFICIPKDSESLAKTFRNLNMLYSQYYNKKHNQKGHLWQGRFFSCLLDSIHVKTAIRYVENNPVRASMVNKAADYKWSSAGEHIAEKYEIVTGEAKEIVGADNWSGYLDEVENEEEIKKLRTHTMKGMPFGSDVFLKKLEVFFKRELRIKSQGRPEKAKS